MDKDKLFVERRLEGDYAVRRERQPTGIALQGGN